MDWEFERVPRKDIEGIKHLIRMYHDLENFGSNYTEISRKFVSAVGQEFIDKYALMADLPNLKFTRHEMHILGVRGFDSPFKAGLELFSNPMGFLNRYNEDWELEDYLDELDKESSNIFALRYDEYINDFSDEVNALLTKLYGWSQQVFEGFLDGYLAVGFDVEGGSLLVPITEYEVYSKYKIVRNKGGVHVFEPRFKLDPYEAEFRTGLFYGKTNDNFMHYNDPGYKAFPSAAIRLD